MLLSKKTAVFSSILLLAACSKEPIQDNTHLPTTPLANETTHASELKQRGQQDKGNKARAIAQQGKKNLENNREANERKIYESIPQNTVTDSAQLYSGSSMAISIKTAESFNIFPPIYIEEGRENYTSVDDNAIKLTNESPVSTFSVDVDTASYSNIRRLLNQGHLPGKHVVRIEELINYFSYDYPQPDNQPFSVHTEIGPSPWNADKHLLHVGIQGKTIEAAERPDSNLVFLIDVSGSMQNPNKIGLLKSSMKMLAHQLNANDSVGIVVYAGAAGVVLKPTSGDNTAAIHKALDQLQAGGSTNGGAGIHAAYALAQQHFIKNGINRVILATDGDFNVGTVNQNALKQLIEAKRKTNISLSVMGFGMGNYNDALMQELAQNGNGNAYYIDTLNEARKVLVEDLNATLHTIAKDVKIQIEFNPNVVSEYRLVGYETRALKREDFNNDKIDAGEVGAGHTVTAIYELALTDSKNKSVDDLRYQISKQSKRVDAESELAFLRLRYKSPTGSKSKLIEIPLKIRDIQTVFSKTSDNFRFSAAVAGFGQFLRDSPYSTTLNMNDLIAMAESSRGTDNKGYRSEFLQLLKLAAAIPSAEYTTGSVSYRE